MSSRLGEMLLHGGALTEAQLEEVLSAQSIYGGRLGTNLVEMGLLSEEHLSRFLNQKLGVPSVEAASLETVPAALIALIPQEMAQRFQVLPLALDGKRLTLAMADPSNFGAIDEIGFFTGMVIVPRVCSELRLSLALERYYGIKRKLHFIPVEGGARTRVVQKTREDAGLKPSVSSSPGVSAPGERAETKTPLVDDSASAPDSGHPEPRAGRDVGTSPGDAVGDAVPRAGMEAVTRRFAAASGEAEVVMTLMAYLGGEFDRAGFLSLKRGSAVGVQAVADGAAVVAFAGCAFGLDGANLLNRVLLEKSRYLGRIPVEGAEGEILARIGGPPGGSALLLPLVMAGVSVAFLLAADEGGRLATGLFDLQRVVAKAALAFEMIGIRRKIGLV